MIVRSNRWASFTLAAVGLVALAGCSNLRPSPTTLTGSLAAGPPVIARGVFIDRMAVGGKTSAQARQLIKSAIALRYGKFKFRFVDPSGAGAYHYSPADFEAHFDVDKAVAKAAASAPGTTVELPLKLNQELLDLHLARIADNWRVPVQEPKVKFNGDSRTISPGHDGRAVDRAAALNVVLANLPTLESPVAADKIPFVASRPRVTPSRVAGLADTLVSFTTTFNPGNRQRTNNLLLAVHNINGTVVGPGETFSYNDSVGPRTQGTGFQDAIIYVNDRMKKDVGGGICQPSSTLYNCVLLANMPIVERHAHSLPVHYLPAGRDATVAWGGDDFRFRNNTSKPIIVRAVATSSGTLTESLIGDRSAVPHPNAKVAIDISPKRSYSDGFAVTSYRVVKENGMLIAKEPLGISFYHNLVGGVPH
jgi:vancomycin resistance protein YoaR